jgi:polysaccharide export outer membrane protein
MKVSKALRVLSFVVLTTLSSAPAYVAWAQERRSEDPPQSRKEAVRESVLPNVVVSPEEDYRIGSNDVIEVLVLKAPELSRAYKVNADGTIEMPFLGKVNAQNKTSQELAKLIANGLRGEYLIDPQVSVMVKQVNRPFFVQGAVRQPGVYQIEGRPSLLELITIAGGLNEHYGTSAFIIHKVRSAESEAESPRADKPGDQSANPQSDSDLSTQGPAKYQLKKANINALLQGQFEQNVTIEPGDILHIPSTDVFFVAGEVQGPGSFPLKEGTTVRQAISLARGTNPKAALGRAILFREDQTGKKQEIPVDVGAVMRGEISDLAIMPNDVLVIPNSKSKSVVIPFLQAFAFSAAWAVVNIP